MSIETDEARIVAATEAQSSSYSVFDEDGLARFKGPRYDGNPQTFREAMQDLAGIMEDNSASMSGWDHLWPWALALPDPIDPALPAYVDLAKAAKDLVAKADDVIVELGLHSPIEDGTADTTVLVFAEAVETARQFLAAIETLA